MMNFVSRFFGWATASASMVAMSGNCPCCGKSFCPQGMALFGIVGGIVGCVLRFFYRPINAESAATEAAPKVWARHERALEFTSRDSNEP